jgi:hypothetical protein
VRGAIFDPDLEQAATPVVVRRDSTTGEVTRVLAPGRWFPREYPG